jgi:hypothetical protein
MARTPPQPPRHRAVSRLRRLSLIMSHPSCNIGVAEVDSPTPATAETRRGVPTCLRVHALRKVALRSTLNPLVPSVFLRINGPAYPRDVGRVSEPQLRPVMTIGDEHPGAGRDGIVPFWLMVCCPSVVRHAPPSSLWAASIGRPVLLTDIAHGVSHARMPADDNLNIASSTTERSGLGSVPDEWQIPNPTEPSVAIAGLERWALPVGRRLKKRSRFSWPMAGSAPTSDATSRRNIGITSSRCVGQNLARRTGRGTSCLRVGITTAPSITAHRRSGKPQADLRSTSPRTPSYNLASPGDSSSGGAC